MFILLVILLVACGAPSAQAVQPAEPPETLVPVSETVPTLEPMKVIIGIQPFASNLPLYIAQQEGYFADPRLAS